MSSSLLKAMLAFFIWGLFPIYFNLIKQISPLTTVVYRVLFCFIFSLVFILIFRQSKQLKELLFKGKHKKKIFLAGLLIGTNWFIFVFAVSQSEVLETSLGYYLSPLLSIFIGIFLLKEKVDKVQKIAIFLLCLAIAYKIYAFGKLPWISLALALTFSYYGFVKKQIPSKALPSFSLETLFILPFSFSVWIIFNYFFYPDHNLASLAESLLGFTKIEGLLLMLQGMVSLVPLLLFASSVKKLSLSTLGYVNFITPTMSFLLGIFYFKEDFLVNDLITFSIIWLALLLINLKNIPLLRKMRKNVEKNS